MRPDLDLARAAQVGDRAALEELLRRHHDRVSTLCRRLTGNGADADDATQEALIAVVRGIRRYDGRAAFTTWLYRVTTNACLDELRRRKRRPLPVGDAFVEPRSSADPAAEAGARVDVDRALAHLPHDFRAAVVLRDLCQLDYAEIADVLDIPIGTVRSRIARGRAAVADALGNQEPPANRPTVSP